MTDDAQRELEQRALRNVRSLVDRIETSDELETRKQRKVLWWILGVVAILLVGIGLFIANRPFKATEIVVDPAKLPPVRAGPQR